MHNKQEKQTEREIEREGETKGQEKECRLGVNEKKGKEWMDEKTKNETKSSKDIVEIAP